MPLFFIRTYSKSSELLQSPKATKEQAFCACVALQLHLPQLLWMRFPKFLRHLGRSRHFLFSSTEALLFLTIITVTAPLSTPNISTPLRAPAAGCWQPQERQRVRGQPSHTCCPSATSRGQPGRASASPCPPR